MRKTNIFI